MRRRPSPAQPHRGAPPGAAVRKAASASTLFGRQPQRVGDIVVKDADGGGLVGGAQIGEGGADAGGVVRLLRGGGERVAARLLAARRFLAGVIPTGRQLLRA